MARCVQLNCPIRAKIIAGDGQSDAIIFFIVMIITEITSSCILDVIRHYKPFSFFTVRWRLGNGLTASPQELLLSPRNLLGGSFCHLAYSSRLTRNGAHIPKGVTNYNLFLFWSMTTKALRIILYNFSYLLTTIS